MRDRHGAVVVRRASIAAAFAAATVITLRAQSAPQTTSSTTAGFNRARLSRLDAAIDEAIAHKPKGHDFVIDRRHLKPALPRHMSMTGG